MESPLTYTQKMPHGLQTRRDDSFWAKTHLKEITSPIFSYVTPAQNFHTNISHRTHLTEDALVRKITQKSKKKKQHTYIY